MRLAGRVVVGMAVVLAGGVVRAQVPATEVILHGFMKAPEGDAPNGGVIRDAAGNLYGTTFAGGTADRGVVFKIDAWGHRTVLHNFLGGADGANPVAGVAFGPDGLYGTTSTGGIQNAGTVYKINAAGEETVLHAFLAGDDGSEPVAGVTLDAAGNVYGTTFFGGPAFAGVVYKIDPSGQETLLHTFAGGAGGNNPIGGVILDADGNLYGTLNGGGKGNSGVVYKIDGSGQETVLHTFSGGADGGGPGGNLIRDAAGNIYGTTSFGGAFDFGTVYKLGPSGKETVLYSFSGGTDGSSPSAGVIGDGAGGLYGTAEYGGANYSGTVFKIETSGQETLLYTFTGGADGGRPSGGVIRDPEGNLYGTASLGGPDLYGTVYKIDPSGEETVLNGLAARYRSPRLRGCCERRRDLSTEQRLEGSRAVAQFTGLMLRAARRRCTNSPAARMGVTRLLD